MSVLLCLGSLYEEEILLDDLPDSGHLLLLLMDGVVALFDVEDESLLNVIYLLLIESAIHFD